MRIINPTDVVKLWIFYQENGIKITGLTDLNIQVVDNSSNILLNTTTLTESVSVAGEYYYLWNTTGINVGIFANIYYKKGTDIIDVEDVYFTYTEDQDSVAM